jgi:hypothetical protein
MLKNHFRLLLSTTSSLGKRSSQSSDGDLKLSQTRGKRDPQHCLRGGITEICAGGHRDTMLFEHFFAERFAVV